MSSDTLGEFVKALGLKRAQLLDVILPSARGVSTPRAPMTAHPGTSVADARNVAVQQAAANEPTPYRRRRPALTRDGAADGDGSS